MCVRVCVCVFKSRYINDFPHTHTHTHTHNFQSTDIMRQMGKQKNT